MSEPDYAREGAAIAAVGLPEETDIGAVRMRPLTAGSAALCALCGNRAYGALTSDVTQIAELTDYDLLEFVYLHTAPLADVRRAVAAGTVKDRALEFGDTLEFGVVFGARKALEAVKAQLEALGVEIEAKPMPGGAKEDTPLGESSGRLGRRGGSS